MTGPTAIVVHDDCGAQVGSAGGELFDLDGPGRVPHLCRDYAAWYGPVDRRDVWTLDVPARARLPYRPGLVVFAAA